MGESERGVAVKALFILDVTFNTCFVCHTVKKTQKQ
jgi:hypothetical protein